MDSGWEGKMAQVLENMDEVIYYVKNQNLGFYIPYTLEGKERNYIPDFIVHMRNDEGELVSLIVEVSGKKDKEKEAKISTARNLWIPAVNNHEGFGRWSFIEITDPWDAQNVVRDRFNIIGDR